MTPTVATVWYSFDLLYWMRGFTICSSLALQTFNPFHLYVSKVSITRAVVWGQILWSGCWYMVGWVYLCRSKGCGLGNPCSTLTAWISARCCCLTHCSLALPILTNWQRYSLVSGHQRSKIGPYGFRVWIMGSAAHKYLGNGIFASFLTFRAFSCNRSQAGKRQCHSTTLSSVSTVG